MNTQEANRRIKLFLRIVLPLFLFLTFTTFISYFLSNEKILPFVSNYLINIATDIFGIIITVWIIDEIIKSHERKQWRLVKYRISKRFVIFIVDFIEYLLRMLKLSNKAVSSATVSGSINNSQIVESSVYIDIVDPKLLESDEYIFTQIKKFPIKKKEIITICDYLDQLTKLIDNYGPQLGPDELIYLLNIQDELFRIKRMFPIFMKVYKELKKDKNLSKLQVESPILVMASSMNRLLNRLMSLYKYLQ